ncbi:MAG: polymerase subunit delta [Solirubrobacteraceae bacterium]|nr:polymerase subunit delta [Solirubrobacteraceae bacterium]
MPAFKPAYLIHGDDHGRIAERRGRLRALAERESGSGGIEILEDDAATPEAAAAALAAMTLALGRRFVIVDGVERWKDSELEPLTAALADLPAETTVAFFAREDSRVKAPAKLHEAVKRAGGDVSAERTVKPWELPKWVAQQAAELGLELEAGVPSALAAQVGERQQRLLRELEKLRLELGADARVSMEDVDAIAARSAERRAWTLADALVGHDAAGATRLYVELRAQGERLPSLLYHMTQRVRLAHDVAGRLDAGESPQQIKRALRMPPKVAERFIAELRGADRDALREALEALADLELDSRGGRTVPEDTAALRTILRIAA